MFRAFKLCVAEQRLRHHSGKYEAYLNEVRQKGIERDHAARLSVATALLKEPEFSRMRSWAEYQRLMNAKQRHEGG